MQRGEWTFDGCSEVTVNIFSMHAMKFVIGKDVINQSWLLGQKNGFKKFFENQPTYDNWKGNCGMALMTFAQLVKHFGWEPMHQFMADYEKDIKARKDLPKNNQEKIDQWVTRYSKIIGRNIAPQFEMWGLPVSEDAKSQVADLPEFCPREETDADAFFQAL